MARAKTDIEQEKTRPPFAERLLRGTLWLLFAGVLLVPKMLSVRRRPRAWNTLRAFVALASIGFLILSITAAGLAIFAGTLSIVIGSIVVAAVLLLAAIVVRPERQRLSLDNRVRELGAIIAVNGGEYASRSGKLVKAHLCVGADRVWVLDERLNVQTEIAFSTLDEVHTDEVHTDEVHTDEVRGQAGSDYWKLSLRSRASTEELIYRQPFAEHFARVAEATIRSQFQRSLPILP